MNQRAIGWCLAFVLACECVFASGVWAQSASIGVWITDSQYPQPSGACRVNFFANEPKFLMVKLGATAGPVKTTRFKVVSSIPAVIVFSGDFNLTFETCRTSGSVLANITVYNTGPAVASCNFDIVPATGDTKIMLTDCDGYPMTGQDEFQSTDSSDPCDDVGSFIAPYRPTPANGATGVPLNTLLSYVGPANMIQFSTQPVPLNIQMQVLCAPSALSYLNKPVCGYPVDPGPLAPNTTYYWRAWNSYWGYNAPVAYSEMFSFTTGDAPLATEASTWGHVKAMYRD